MLQGAKGLNMPRWNLMSRETIKDTIIKYKKIIFGVDDRTRIKYMDEHE